jgi:hypothetical protein
MDTIIMLRMPNGGVACVTDEDDEIVVYANLDEAISRSENVPLIKAGFPFQIIELDEL